MQSNTTPTLSAADLAAYWNQPVSYERRILAWGPQQIRPEWLLETSVVNARVISDAQLRTIRNVRLQLRSVVSISDAET